MSNAIAIALRLLLLGAILVSAKHRIIQGRLHHPPLLTEELEREREVVLAATLVVQTLATPHKRHFFRADGGVLTKEREKRGKREGK